MYTFMTDHVLTELRPDVKESQNQFLNRFFEMNSSKEPFLGSESDFPSLLHGRSSTSSLATYATI